MNIRSIILAMLIVSYINSSMALELTIPNQFQSGTKALAAEVNDNFEATAKSVNDNDDRILALEALVVQLQAQLQAIEENTVLQLNNVVRLEDVIVNGETYPTVIFNSVNVQVVDGSTDTGGVTNGLGNVIVGYNESSNISKVFCSVGAFDNQDNCEENGFVWERNQRTGSHNLIVGSQNAYTSYAGAVFGSGNVISAQYAVVSGGSGNLARGQFSSISGGVSNESSGLFSNVSSGIQNEASGAISSVSGGSDNRATGQQSSITGGNQNWAFGNDSTINGGQLNQAEGSFSSISGGNQNWSFGEHSVVSGGRANQATGNNSVVSGGSSNQAGGFDAVVSAGSLNQATGIRSVVSGGRNRTAEGLSHWVAGSLLETN